MAEIVKEQNFVSNDANWRSHLKKEKETAKAFDSAWGYLKATEEEVAPRPFEARLVKYYTKGTWTVLHKRIPKAEEGSQEEEPHTNRFIESRKGAAVSAPGKRTTSDFHTTNSEYGGIGQLEMFGVAQFGLKGSLSKTPPFGIRM